LLVVLFGVDAIAVCATTDTGRKHLKRRDIGIWIFTTIHCALVVFASSGIKGNSIVGLGFDVAQLFGKKVLEPISVHDIWVELQKISNDSCSIIVAK